jgi:hypothetical protein
VLLAQQGAPAAPHFMHVRTPVDVLVPQTLPASVQAVPVVQQAWPSLPHFMHVRRPVVLLVMQAFVGSAHTVPVVQQASPSFPHSHVPATQVPDEDVIAFTHDDIWATHRFDEQQSVAVEHLLPGQQGLPVTPHGRQVFELVSQTTEGSPHRLPVQHGSPGPPHFRHWYVLDVVDRVQMVAAVSLQVPEVLVALIGQHG